MERKLLEQQRAIELYSQDMERQKAEMRRKEAQY